MPQRFETVQEGLIFITVQDGINGGRSIFLGPFQKVISKFWVRAFDLLLPRFFFFIIIFYPM